MLENQLSPAFDKSRVRGFVRFENIGPRHILEYIFDASLDSVADGVDHQFGRGVKGMLFNGRSMPI